MMPLSMVRSGESVQVAAIRAGWGLQRIRGSRLALGHGIAHKIMVT